MGDENSLQGRTQAHKHESASSTGGFLETGLTGITNLSNGSMVYGDASEIVTELNAGNLNDVLTMGATLPSWVAPAGTSSAWEILAQTTLGVASGSIGVFWGAADVKDFLQIYAWTLDGSGGAIRRYLCFSGDGLTYDVGNNYATQFSSSFGAATSATGATGIAGSDNGSAFETIEVCCADIAQSKLAIRHGTVNTNNSAATAPTNRQMFGKWANITQNIRGVQLNQGGGAGTYGVGSGLIVLGTDL